LMQTMMFTDLVLVAELPAKFDEFESRRPTLKERGWGTRTD
jgi:hypothetical protein